MSIEYKVISIGALAQNRLWGESAPARTSHATTTLVEEGEKLILVDPSLPATALAARFNERTGKTLQDVTDVFCTTLRPVHRRAVEALPQAKWWCGEQELETYRDYLKGLADSAGRLSAEDEARIKGELKVVDKFRPCPDELARQVQLYPLTGSSAGAAGLLLAPATLTVVIAGDAALTSEHVQRGQIWEGCFDTEAALKSLEDMLEVADVIIPGHDNLMFSPRTSWY